jgi:hypothetical protein
MASRNELTRTSSWYHKEEKEMPKPYKITIRNTAMVKFLGTISANKRYFTDDWPVYREADRLLMLAEIVNAEGGDPTIYIKPIRDRAFAPVVDPQPFVSSITQVSSNFICFLSKV